jgi:ElaB/YqjD/DUF883 family membrane-anchored ribosome-binding protein
MMFGYSNGRRDVGDIERRIRALEMRLERTGRFASRASSDAMARAAQSSDRLGEVVLSALGDLVDRFRSGGQGVGRDIARFGDDAARLGQEASRIGGEALDRVSREVKQRPLLMIAVAVGVGLLIGLGGRRR